MGENVSGKVAAVRSHPSSRSRRSAVLELFYPSLFGCGTFFSTEGLFRFDERGEPTTSCERGEVRQRGEKRYKKENSIFAPVRN